MSATLKQLQGCFEPVARAIRRGDQSQLKSLVNELAEIWRTAPAWPDSVTQHVAQGMKIALEGVLNFAVSRSRGDAAVEVAKGRKHALPALHALGLCARELKTTGTRNELNLTELAQRVGAKPQNLSAVLQELQDLGLVRSSRRGTARNLEITEDGLQLLETLYPGWQAEQPSSDVEFEHAAAQISRKIAASFLHQMEGNFRREEYYLSAHHYKNPTELRWDLSRRETKVHEPSFLHWQRADSRSPETVRLVRSKRGFGKGFKSEFGTDLLLAPLSIWQKKKPQAVDYDSDVISEM